MQCISIIQRETARDDSLLLTAANKHGRWKMCEVLQVPSGYLQLLFLGKIFKYSENYSQLTHINLTYIKHVHKIKFGEKVVCEGTNNGDIASHGFENLYLYM